MRISVYRRDQGDVEERIGVGAHVHDELQQGFLMLRINKWSMREGFLEDLLTYRC